MKCIRNFISALILLVVPQQLIQANECLSGEKEVIIQVIGDSYPLETSWELKDHDGIILISGLVVGDTICVDSTLCLTFTIYDTYGDGICCGFGDGSYSVYYGGVLVAAGGDFNYSEATAFNCPPGFVCESAIEVGVGEFVAPDNNTWYVFTPDTTGIYTIGSCDNSCDTKIWIYDQCTDLFLSEDNTGAIYYSDNEGSCGPQAEITAFLETEFAYYIRIGSAEQSCSVPINWEISFGGEISGCMDSSACNYNPLASIDDGSCIYMGDDNCSGPDLWVLEDVLRNSLHAAVVVNDNDNCLINEGCVQGFGSREVARFTTHIKNIGDLDYYIGSPSANPDQFSYDNCHQHNHYEGYAEYRLINSDNQLMPIGFKNGFCVIDLECSGGGTPQFGCGNMGITAGCGDYYSSGLQCQWVDLTEMEEGDYTLILTTNWDRSPDALGRYETDYDNNWAQACFNLSRDSTGHFITLLEDCPTVVDCAGTPFGDAVEDCMGNCGGSLLYGDINGDFAQNTTDAERYIFDIINGGLDAQPCFDLDLSGTISVYDAALINSCFLYGTEHNHPGGGNIHNHCNLPGGITNPGNTATLSVIDIDYANSTIDIGINNPTDQISAYEFDISGAEIESVISLVDPSDYPVDPDYLVGGQKIIAMTMVDSKIPRTNGEYQPLCRIQFSNPTGDQICI